ncbi:MAG: hypothetical protein PHF97_03915 [Bacteroidales bacterium]|nr:hypothetical protein [Bacteroidales bacterium]MDD4602936.1 hypothetical protein [Bacteroidales bacterium]
MWKWLSFVFLAFLLLGSSNSRDVYVDERTSTEICFSVSEGMFPKHWYGGKIKAEAMSLDRLERNHFIIIMNRAFDKYPESVLKENLNRIYALKKMRFYGIPFGGTNVQNTVFICDDEQNSNFSDEYIERVFHHEFSSVLKRAFPHYFNETAWENVNAPNFIYGNGGVNAIVNGDASMKLDPGLFNKGFLTRYSLASLEEDMNVFAQQLFSGSNDFWEIVDQNIRIRQKAHILIAFYQKIDPRFSENYFRHLSDKLTWK